MGEDSHDKFTATMNVQLPVETIQMRVYRARRYAEQAADGRLTQPVEDALGDLQLPRREVQPGSETRPRRRPEAVGPRRLSQKPNIWKRHGTSMASRFRSAGNPLS